MNLNGRRWVDETKGIMNGMSQLISDQPKEISYAIFPYDQIKACAERYVNTPAYANKKQFYATWEADLEEESKLDTPVKKADTLEELATMIGADPKVFIDEIKKYNSFCEKGVDEDFGKDKKFLIPIPLDKGPYYAVYGQRFSEAPWAVSPSMPSVRCSGTTARSSPASMQAATVPLPCTGRASWPPCPSLPGPWRPTTSQAAI